MLTGKLVRVRHVRNRLIPSYLEASAPEWLEVAERLLTLFRGQEGRSRGEIAADVQETFGSDPQTLVHQGLAKLLEDRCEFEVVAGHPPEQLRELVFQAATRHRSAMPYQAHAWTPGDQAWKDGMKPPAFDRTAVLREVADSLRMTPEAVEGGLFADLRSEQRLVKFHDISAERLLQRYNGALAQAVLLKATRVTVDIHYESPQRYRQLLRAIKFHRLLAEIDKKGPDHYQLRLDGPLSLFTATQKYGLQLALFLPWVLLCRHFELRAEVRWGSDRKEKTFQLTSGDGLVSHLSDVGTFVPPEVSMFAELFRKRVKTWDLLDETDVLPLGDTFWVPDFRLVHRQTGKVVYLEVLGFWRRASAEKHLQRLRQHAGVPFLLAVSEQLRISDAQLEGLPAGIHHFRQMPLPGEIARLADELSQS